MIAVSQMKDMLTEINTYKTNIQSTKTSKTTSKTLMPQRWPAKQREQYATKVACQTANRMPQMWPANEWTGCKNVVCKTVNRMPQRWPVKTANMIPYRWPVKQRAGCHKCGLPNSGEDATKVACQTVNRIPQRWPVKQPTGSHKGGLSNNYKRRSLFEWKFHKTVRKPPQIHCQLQWYWGSNNTEHRERDSIQQQNLCTSSYQDYTQQLMKSETKEGVTLWK